MPTLASRAWRSWFCLFAALFLCACATAKNPTIAGAPRPSKIVLREARFSDLSAWEQTDAKPALEAFQRSCKVIAQQPPESLYSGSAKYGGLVQDWIPACAAAMATQPAEAHNFFELNFVPYEVLDEGDGLQKVTGYYEPVIEARKVAEPGFEEALYARPDDLLQIDLGQFAKAYNSGPDTNLKGVIWGMADGKRVTPYPARGARPAGAAKVLGYAHPADVYDLQVQGSARLKFPDGVPMRAGYAASNGWKWNSIYKVLKDDKQIPPDQLNKPTVRQWMDQAGPAATRELLHRDPSEVFFTLEPILDPSIGPKGAQGVPLTPEGSVAVDPAFHPYGGVLFLDGTGPDSNLEAGAFRRLVVAQDTGGAIRRGPLRADFYFGSGDSAGQRAQRMNAPARFWTLLPSARTAVVTN